MRRLRVKQGVALTGRNRRGLLTVSAVRPPTRPAAGRPVRRQRYRRQTTTDDDDRHQRQRPLLVCPPHYV